MAKIEELEEQIVKLKKEIERLKKENQRLAQLAKIDALTNLHNKYSIGCILEEEINYASRHDIPLTIIMIDINKFKMINDTYGHLAGDKILICLGKILKNLRKYDQAGRFGGDEFLVVLRNTTEDGSRAVAERLIKNMEQLDYQHEKNKIKVSISLGIARWQKGEGVFELIERADQALYQAKHLGNNKIMIANSTNTD